MTIRVAYGGSFLLLRKIYKAYYERNSSSVGRALVNIPYHGSMVRIHSCYKSGLSIPSWCKEKGITPGTFYGWIKQVSNKGYDVSTFTRHGTAYKWRVF